ncbi:MAG: ATP-dependent RecD-like DNA helicase [Planctomycetes bacterium]|nr:ATP-dependent RecD-like DNA helicase [Planctomycetota bacterium]
MSQKADSRPSDRVEGLEGTVERFSFRSAETGFAVARFAPDDGGPPISIVGQLAQIAEGQHVRVSGTRRAHAKFGPQLEVEVCEAALPQSPAGIVSYLSSSLVKGVGPATAERIVAAFGADTLRVIEEDPERLREVKGLGRKRIAELVTAVRSQRDVQEVMVFLRTHGLGQALAVRIVKRFGRNASALIQADPYRLADEVVGIGFKTADQLASRLGIEKEAPARIDAGLLHVLGLAAREGHAFLRDDDIAARTAALLAIDETPIRARLPELERQGRVVKERIGDADAIYPIALRAAERGVADAIQSLLRVPGMTTRVAVDRAVEDFTAESGFAMPDAQREAVARAFASPFSVITGGPGVGKTTIVRAIAATCERSGLLLLLAAPTGRAAKRLSESTGCIASTIHRLLEWQAGINRFQRDAEHRLEGDVLVVDECSMLDVQLAYHLFRAVPPGMRVVLVGDVDQLPSIGPGRVLADLIDCDRIPVTRLSTIFRQGAGSRIVRAAHAVLAGELPQSGGEGDDFFFVEAKSAAHAKELVLELVTTRIPRRFGLDPLADVQVLCPMYRGDAGADALNVELQARLNPRGDELQRGSKLFRVGDKVLQVKNDYDLDVFNGDVGRVIAVDRADSLLRVRFDEREVEYPFADLDQLVPAYAITVHRAQGSEYPAVIVPLLTEHYVMLRRNLFYTAITRGRQLVVVVGVRKALELAVRTSGEVARNSGLAERLSISSSSA